MDDLAEFLRARLDEDEAVAREATPGRWYPIGEDIRAQSGDRHWDGACAANATGADAVHIVRHEPARVLREVEAKRAIVALHKPDTDGDCFVCLTTRDRWKEDWPLDKWPCRTVLIVAAVYSDHPDYRQEWKP